MESGKESLTDEEFIKEMKVLWRGNAQKFGNLINGYFAETPMRVGDRAHKIILKLQERF